MNLLDRFLPRVEFDSYRDFQQNFRIDVPEDFDFARDVVDAYARLDPGKRALVYANDSGEARTFSFAEISELSRQAAAYFAHLGIRSGDRVITLLRRRWEYWVVAVALHRMGAVLVPASIQLTTKDIAYRVDACSAVAVISIDSDFVLSQTTALKALCPTLRHLIVVGSGAKGRENFSADFQKYGLFDGYSGGKNSDEMVIYFTSGTSGYPKMAIHDRTYPLGHIVTARYMQRVSDDGLHLTQADSGWAKFGWGNIYGQWIAGSAVLGYDPERFNSSNFLAVMEKYGPTSLCIPPTMYRFLMRDGLEKRHVQTVRWFATAGEALSGEVNKEFFGITGHYIHEGYGQSEGTPITASYEWLKVRPSSMGCPSPLYHVALIHPDGSLCARGETGEVVILQDGPHRPLGLLAAYYRDGVRTDPIADGVYHTGDEAYEDEDGFYWYVGRNDDMIKCSGYRIGPFEIESVLNTHPAVRESAIVGAPDPVRGQVVCAVVVLREGYEPSDELTLELQKHVKANTAPYKYPRIVRYVDALPKTTSGKIIRSAIR